MEKAPAASAPPAEDDKLIEIQHAEPVEAAWSLRRPRTRRNLLPLSAPRRSRASSSASCSGRWARRRAAAATTKTTAARSRPRPGRSVSLEIR